MSKTAVVLTCAHSTPEVSNERFTWLGKFLFDLKPDYVVDLGDFYDLKSLNSYDTRYPQAIVSQSYQSDIEHGLDSQERLRHQFKKHKKRVPKWYGFAGNHEERLNKALAHDPRLEGDKFGISFKHLQTDKFYDEYHPYVNGGPAIHTYDGVSYAHFFSSGNYGTAMSGQHHANSLLQHLGRSATCGHSHKRDIKFKDGAGYGGKGMIGLVAGCYKGGKESWAGQSNNDWAKGVWIKRNIDNGMYDPEWVSLSTLEREYG